MMIGYSKKPLTPLLWGLGLAMLSGGSMGHSTSPPVHQVTSQSITPTTLTQNQAMTAQNSVQNPVQRQLVAYNNKDLTMFVAQYSDDIKIYRPPSADPIFNSKAEFAAFYQNNRFNLPHLYAEVTNRMVVGNKVIDHERVTGIGEGVSEVVVVYEVKDGLIAAVWFFNSE